MKHNAEAPAQFGQDGVERPSQRVARMVLAAALVVLGLWILHRYLAALVWAAVLAIALWPLYQRLVRALGGHGQQITAPLILTLSIGLVFIVPFAYAAVELARETQVFVQYLVDARHNGIPVPDWVAQQFERLAGCRTTVGTDLLSGSGGIGPSIRRRDSSSADPLRFHLAHPVLPVPRWHRVEPAAD